MKRKNSLFSRPAAKKPVKSREPLAYPETLEIERLSHEGRGVARHQGKTLFISGALPGETVRFSIDTKHRRFDEGHCVEVITPANERTDPVCPHYGVCGGCDLQHLAHDQQINAKQEIVLEQLQRLGKFRPEQIEAPITSPAWHYRRSARIGVNQLLRDGSPLIGFRRRGSSKLTQIEHCPVLAPALEQIMTGLREVLATADQFKEITHAELTQGDTEGALTLRVKKTPQPELCVKLQQLAESHNFKLYLDNGEQIRAYAGDAELFYQHAASGAEIHFKPGDFIQVNASVNQQMIDRALAWLTPSAEDSILDLFSGVGNFTLPLARQAGRVVGIEGVDEMVHRARDNVQRNQQNNCEFFRADLSKDLRAMAWYKQGFNKILLDPPRTGALEIIRQLQQHKADTVLYVSCNPAALARDGAELIRQGYRASRFCVMDMFPHTSHVESLALFERH
ncbi:23S rRNA (uracil(1939)-C(5))-methyltransferase RlmD [Neptuniibacter halophilus]|uniref:23S rRNA (uracil(1939)-C(5))-methyltransferase RlmD n=1 Tax=Neptuniibacter halophilus TaxID=651666 RepID=UPI002572D053|nr:23S rRNA (uracil(1939)-C(5))-methyltransferase RlmD [Neptuniibacter halophilus]